MEGKVSKKKTKETGKENILKIVLYILIIVLISLISFGGIIVKNKNKFANVLPDYILGSELSGTRNVVIKVDDSTETKTFDADGNEVSETTSDEDSEAQETTTKEIPVNDESVLTYENYQKSKDIVLQRLKYMEVDYYEIKFDEATGTIYLEIPENEYTDYMAQYSVTKGEFKIADNETGEVLLTNSNIKKASPQYYTDSTGTNVYLNIEFDKNSKEKLKEISNTYVKTTDDEGNETEKKVDISIDSENIMSTSFEEEMTDGVIQIRIGVGTDTATINQYIQQAQNIAVLLNTDHMPISYKMEVNRFVYSDISSNTIKFLVIALSVIAALLVIYMIFKYGKTGLLGTFASIGFLSILLIIIRYANVQLTLSGIMTIFISFVAEYCILMHVFKAYCKEQDEESRAVEMKNSIKASYEILIPLGIIAICFALASWEPVFSIGMVLFWSIIEMLVYNIVSIKIICGKEGR